MSIPEDDAGPPPGAAGPETEAKAPGEAPPAEAAAGPPSPEELEDLRKRAAERDEYLDLLKRARADFANYQKRVAEDRKRWGLAAQRDLLARLLSAADQCRLSAAKSKEDDSAESLRDCIGLIWAELEKFLDSSGVRIMPTRGEPFDPHRHQAVVVQERNDLPDATIVDEVRPGYEFAEQVIRPAQVVVSKRPKAPEPAPAAEGGAGPGGEPGGRQSGDGPEGAGG